MDYNGMTFFRIKTLSQAEVYITQAVASCKTFTDIARMMPNGFLIEILPQNATIFDQIEDHPSAKKIKNYVINWMLMKWKQALERSTFREVFSDAMDDYENILNAAGHKSPNHKRRFKTWATHFYMQTEVMPISEHDTFSI